MIASNGMAVPPKNPNHVSPLVCGQPNILKRNICISNIAPDSRLSYATRPIDRWDVMNIVDEIIKKFGTQERLAAAIEPPVRQCIISGWKRRGCVPTGQQRKVLAAARKLGIQLGPQDFFEKAPVDNERPNGTSAPP